MKADDAVVRLRDAQALIRRGALDQAYASLLRLCDAGAAPAEAWMERSGLEARRGLVRTAITSARRALALEPANHRVRAHLAQLLVDHGLAGDAVEVLRTIGEPEAVREPIVANAVGAVLALAGLHPEARGWMRRAVALAPGHVGYRFNLAMAAAHVGDADWARHALEAILRDAPGYAKARWALAASLRVDSPFATPEALRQASAAADRSGHDWMYLHYALFAALDNDEGADAAFDALQVGLDAQRRLIGERAAARDLEVLQRLVALPAPQPVGAAPEESRPVPIFIVGLPRSGTTVIERILSNHPLVAQGGERTAFAAALRERAGVESSQFVPPELLHRLPGLDLSGIGQRYLELTRHLHGGLPYFTDKLPFNFMLIPWIATALPEARIINMVRDPMDVCFSNLKQLFTRAFPASCGQRSMAEYYLAYERCLATWSRQWPRNVLRVAYESLVDDPEGMAALILGFCGLPAHAGVAAIERNEKPVSTASAAQVRRPIDRRSVGAWRRYAHRLDELQRTLAGA